MFEPHQFKFCFLQKLMHSPAVSRFDMFHSVNVFSKYFQ